MKFYGMALPMGVAATEPKELIVFPVGEPPQNDKRKWRFTHEDLANVVADFDARTEPLVVDYGHGSDQSKGLKAAGWVDSLTVKPDGLYARVRWTKQAKAEIDAGEWGFRSPEFDGVEDSDGFIHPTALVKIGLVNDPAIGGMVPVAAGQNGTAPPRTAGKETHVANEPTVTAAKTKAGAFDGAGILKLVRDSYGIPDVIDDSTLGGLVASALAGGKTDDEMPPAGASDSLPPALGLFASKTTPRIEAVEKELAAMRTTKEIEAVIEKGVADLVLTPALVETARLLAAHAGLEPLKSYVASLKPTAPPAGQNVTPGGDTTDEPRNSHDHVGIAPSAFDPERFAAHKAAIAYMEKAEKSGTPVSYRAAVELTARKSA
jgi:hypothetical protein